MKTTSCFIIALLSFQSLSDAEETTLLLSISSSGSNTAGSNSYRLECTVIVESLADGDPNITWSDNNIMDIISSDATRNVSTTTSSCDGSYVYSSTLFFNPLRTSHAGVYECRASLDSLSNRSIVENATNINFSVDACSKLISDRCHTYMLYAVLYP